MPLFRSRQAPAGAATATSAAPAIVGIPSVGLLPCSEAGCDLTTGVLCSYMDRHFHACDTAWCARHAITIDDLPYCRRHAGTVRALVGAGTGDGPPDVDCRAASLLAWVTRDMDAYVVAALTSVQRHGETLKVDALRLGFEKRGRRRVWERTWKLVGHSGFGHWVAFHVSEDLDDHVDILVDAVHVHRSVPPWITNRREGRSLGPAEDDAQRAAWYAELARAIRTELASR